METPHLNKDFSHFTDPLLLTEGEHVVEKMTGNTDFPSPTPTVPAVEKSVNAYALALGAAKDGDHAAVLTKDEKRKDLETLLSALAVDCNSKSTDAAVLAGTGMKLAATKAKVGPLAKAGNFKVAPGPNKGSVKLSVDKVEGASFYEFQFTPAPLTAASQWQTRTSRKKTIIIDGFVRGSEWVFRAAGAGSDSSRIWSEELSSFIL